MGLLGVCVFFLVWNRGCALWLFVEFFLQICDGNIDGAVTRHIFDRLKWHVLMYDLCDIF